MAIISLFDGTTMVDLTDDNPTVDFVSDQLIEQNPYYGANMSENVDLGTFVDIITITAEIQDVTKFNNIQTLRTSGNPIKLSWNSNETTKPKLDHTNATGEVTVIIIKVELHQDEAEPPNNYKLTLTCGVNIT